jgi:hypothetical protein
MTIWLGERHPVGTMVQSSLPARPTNPYDAADEGAKDGGGLSARQIQIMSGAFLPTARPYRIVQNVENHRFSCAASHSGHRVVVQSVRV